MSPQGKRTRKKKEDNSEEQLTKRTTSYATTPLCTTLPRPPSGRPCPRHHHPHKQPPSGYHPPMTTTGPLAPTRGTRAWSQLAEQWQRRINNEDGWTCRRCLERIPPRDRSAWQLGHPNDTTHDGDHVTLDELEPEHAHRCNGSAGAAQGNRDRTRPPAPSRTWL